MCFESHPNQKVGKSLQILFSKPQNFFIFTFPHTWNISGKMFVMFSFTEELEEASSKIMVWSVFEQFKRFFFHV